MGFLSEIKKLLFVKKAVAKSQTEKAVDFGLEKGKDIADKSADILKDTGDILSEKTSGLRDSVLEKSGDVFGSIKDTANSTFDSVKDADLVKKAGDTVGGLGETIVAAGGTLVDKTKDVIGDVTDSDFVKNTADFTEKVGDKVLDTGEAFMDKAKEVAGPVSERLSEVKDDLKDKLDETMDKADAMAAEEKLNPPKEFADDVVDASGSLLEGTDDFFSKADKFADGDYGAFSEGKITVSDERVEIEKPNVKAAGFQDLDGDGDEIIDDALIIEDTSDDILALDPPDDEDDDK
jgi:gas vesicle protein